MKTREELALEKLASITINAWGRKDEGGYLLPIGTIQSGREECKVEDLISWIENYQIET